MPLTTNSSFKLLHANVRSLVKNHDKLELLIKSLDSLPQVIGITETRLKNDFQFKPNITGYNLECVNSKTNAGGVAIYIKNNISYKIINNLRLNLVECEDIWIETSLNQNKQKLIIGVVYRHPSYNLKPFIESFENSIEKINRMKANYIVCGDFNINLLKNNSTVTDYLDSLTASGCKQYIDIPTRYSPDNNSQSLLDHIYSNINSNNINCDILNNDISDHLPILAKITDKPIRYIKQFTYQRDMSKFNSSEFLTDLKKQMSSLTSHNFVDVDKSTDLFLNTYNEIVEKHAPIRKLNKKQQNIKRKPWITPAILKSINTKNKLFKKYISLKTAESTENYKKYRNKLNHIIDRAKKSYYINLFQSNQQDSRAIWKNIEKIIKFKTPRANQINRIEVQDKIITDPQLITENFNDYFANVGTNLSKLIPTTNALIKPEELIKVHQNSLFLRPIYNKEILDMINKLDLNKSTPLQFPPTKILKISAEIISPILTKLFNLCFIKGAFPSQFKISEIRPIYKSGPKTETSNYRPISLLSPFSKLLEKCIYARLNNFLNSKHLLYDSQFGFRNNASTENAVLQLYNQLLDKLNKNQITCSIFIDLKKAFDTVDHSILIQKLRRYGIRGEPLNLLSSYLSNRLQYTVINNHSSQYKPINCGVPQGSTLGPLLFLIYINDLYLASKFDLNLFADDAYLAMSGTSPNELAKNVNKELVKIYNWLNLNKLSLNVDKTKYLIIKNNRKTIDCNFNIKFGSQFIEKTDQIKYLGVIIDSKLNWKPHIDYIKKKISSGCWALYKLKNFLNKQILKQIYYGLIHQRLQYCVSCWGGGSTKSDLNKLEVLQRKAMRNIDKTHYMASTSIIFKKYKILKLKDIYDFQISKIMFKIDRKSWLGKFDLMKVNQIHSYNTRAAHSGNFYMEANKVANSSITKIGPKLWYSIPSDIKKLNFKLFKQTIKNQKIASY